MLLLKQKKKHMDELYSSLYGKQYMENKCSVSCFALSGHLVQISFYNFSKTNNNNNWML